jgi:hypothetical protein
MRSEFCREIVSEGFGSHLSVEKVEEVEKVEGSLERFREVERINR